MNCVVKRTCALFLVGVISFSTVFFSYKEARTAKAFTGIEEGILISALLSLIGVVVPGVDTEQMVDWWQDPTNEVSQFVKYDFGKEWNDYYTKEMEKNPDTKFEKWETFLEKAGQTAVDGVVGSFNLREGLWDFLKYYGSKVLKGLQVDTVPGMDDYSYELFCEALYTKKITPSGTVYDNWPVSKYLDQFRTDSFMVNCRSDGKIEVSVCYDTLFYITLANGTIDMAYLRYGRDPADSSSYAWDSSRYGLLVDPSTFDVSFSYSPKPVLKSQLYDHTAYLYNGSLYKNAEDYIKNNPIDDWGKDSELAKYYDVVGTFSELKDAMLGLNDKLDSLQLSGVNSATGEKSDVISVNTLALQDYLAGRITYAEYLERIGSKVVDAVDDTVVSDDPDVDGKPVKPAGSEFLADLKQLFPFCIPFDLIRAFDVLSAEGVAPKWDIPIKIPRIGFDYTISIDFALFDGFIQVFRVMEVLGFIFCLIFATRNLIKG